MQIQVKLPTNEIISTKNYESFAFYRVYLYKSFGIRFTSNRTDYLNLQQHVHEKLSLRRATLRVQIWASTLPPCPIVGLAMVIYNIQFFGAVNSPKHFSILSRKSSKIVFIEPCSNVN